MGHKNGKLQRAECEVNDSDDCFSEDEIAEAVKNKKALFNPFFRILIAECYAQAHAELPARIVHRCSQQRHDFKDFVDVLGPERKISLKEDLNNLLEEVIARLDDEEAVKRVSRAYGRAQVPLRHLGHKPDFFAAIADAIATECVFIGGQVAAASPTNTFKAWTVLVGVMFTAVRDGYYAELRRTRRQSPGIDGERTNIENAKHSSMDSSASSSNGDRRSPSVSSRSSPRFHRSSSGTTGDEPVTVTITSPPHASTAGNAARRAYKGSRSAAIMNGSAHGTTSSRSYDSVVAECAAHSQTRDYRLQPQHRSQDLLRAESPRDGGHVGRFKKNVSLDHDKRRQRLEEIGKKHSTGYLSRNHSDSSSSSIFDPNRIIDAFMNDEPF